MARKKVEPGSMEMFPTAPPQPLPKAWGVADVLTHALVATMPQADLRGNEATRLMLLQPAADLLTAHLRDVFGLDLVATVAAARLAYGHHSPIPVLGGVPYCDRCKVRIRRVEFQRRPYWRHVAVRRRGD